MSDLLKVVDGNIFMGETQIFGHCCQTLAEKEAYCKSLNDMADPEFDKMRAESNKRLAELSPVSRKEIRDLLGDDWRHD